MKQLQYGSNRLRVRDLFSEMFSDKARTRKKNPHWYRSNKRWDYLSYKTDQKVVAFIICWESQQTRRPLRFLNTIVNIYLNYFINMFCGTFHAFWLAAILLLPGKIFKWIPPFIFFSHFFYFWLKFVITDFEAKSDGVWLEIRPNLDNLVKIRSRLIWKIWSNLKIVYLKYF